MDSPNDNAPPPLTDGTHRVSTSGDVEVSTYLGIAQEREQASGARRSIGESEPLKPEGIAVIDFGSQYRQAHRTPRPRAERLLRTDLRHRTTRSRRRGWT